jgi:hypothetical protein
MLLPSFLPIWCPFWLPDPADQLVTTTTTRLHNVSKVSAVCPYIALPPLPTMDPGSPSSDEYDGASDYHPSSQVPTVATTTPSKRLQVHSISAGTKARVRDADPHGGRCLVENCPPERAVEFAHCYPRSSSKLDSDVSSISPRRWWRSSTFLVRCPVWNIGGT